MTPDTPPRILFCETNADGTIGGSYYSLLYLIKGLDPSRYQAVALFSNEHGLVPAFQAAGAETIIWPPPEPFTFAHRVTGALRPLQLPALTLQKVLNLFTGFVWAAVTRARFLKTHDIRIVHLNNTVNKNHEWMAAALLAGRACVTHERGINVHFSRMAKFLGRRLDAIICISGAVRDNMRARGIDFPNVITIHNGLDPDMMRTHTAPADLRARLGIEPDAPVIVMVGNIKPWKGQDTVVRAMDVVRRACPEVRCVLVGDTAQADQEFDRTLRDLVAELGLEKHIIFAGFQANVTDFLMMSDAMVHASVAPEPFGRVILEAMACRKPVIATRAGAIPELVAEGETGITFTPGDAVALANAVARVIRDRRTAQQLGLNGYHRLLKEFHVERNVEATEQLYDRLLQPAH
jgi:glycosyltransferase involved in cell wall biosynthesis